MCGVIMIIYSATKSEFASEKVAQKSEILRENERLYKGKSKFSNFFAKRY